MTTAAQIVTVLACDRPGCACGMAVRRGVGDVHCPSHQDRAPSLSVTERDTKTLLHCQAGCSQESVLAALQARGLWGGASGSNGHGQAEPTAARSRATAATAASGGRKTDYPIRDTSGVVVAVHRRTDGAEGKRFAWLRPDGQAGLNGTRACDVPLYRSETLSALLSEAPAVVVEGERAADALADALAGRAVGVLGTVTGAASISSDEVLRTIAGRRVTLWPDADQPGREHMERIAARLLGLGCPSVRVVDWAEAPEHGDAVDHLATHAPAEVMKLLKAAQPWQPATAALSTAVDNAPRAEPSDTAAKIDLSGDHLNADRFLLVHGGNVKWSPELGRWFTWNSAWWEEDRREHVQDLARQTVDGLRAWAAEAQGDEYRRRSAHYVASAKAGRAEALLQVVRTRASVVVGIDELDQHPYRLPCENGTLDLRTGELLTPDPALLLTQGVRVAYDPEARSELWETFLRTTFGNDLDLLEFTQRLLGYACSGVVAEHVAPVLWGAGANGKSTLLGVVGDVLGDMAMTAPEGLFAVGQHEPHPERLASLRGKRLVVCYEMEARVTLAESTVKTLTGGDRLSARELYGRRFTFAPTHKALIVTNHKPRVRGTDVALWRRLRLVPFEHSVPPEDQLHDLRLRLVRDHGPAILTWLVQGAVAWTEHGLGTATAVDIATSNYRSEQDVLGEFLGERTESQPGGRVGVGELWSAWQTWSEAAGEKVGRKQDFSAALAEHQIEIETDGHTKQKYVRGLALCGDCGGLSPNSSSRTRIGNSTEKSTALSAASSNRGVDPASDPVDHAPTHWPDGTPHKAFA